MSDFESQAAPPLAVTIGGREYLFTPLRFRDHAEAARRLRQDWLSSRVVLQRMGTGLPPDLQRQLLEVVYRELRRGEMVELADVLRWYRTPEGTLFHKWLMLRRSHPELTLEDVDCLLTQATAQESAHLFQPNEETDGLPPGWNLAGEESLRNIPWTELFARLAQQYGWTPAEMEQMTIAQLLQYLTVANADGTKSDPLTREEAIRVAQQREQKKEAFINAHEELFQHES